MSQILPPARPAVTPERVLATLTAYQRTAALDLDLFAALRAGPQTAAAMAAKCAASPLGMRSLCDYLAVTYAELERMLRNAGFSDSERHGLAPSPECAIICRR
jgi:hypothetical protein